MPSQDDKTQFIVLGRKEHHDEVPSFAAPLDTSNVITPSMEDVTRIMTTNPRSSDTQSPTPEAFDIDDFFDTSHDDVTASTEDFQASSDHQVGAINFANQAPQSNLPPIGSEEPGMVFNTIVHAIGGNQYQSRALAPGEVIDRYQVIEPIAEGAATRSPNPNVLAEAAHARALNKDLILISQSSPEDLPFDWRHMPVLQYENSTDGLKKLVSELTHKIQSLRRNNSTEL